MKYQSMDTELFLKSREYIDTVIVPLNPVAFDEEYAQTVSSYEFITLLTYELEKELKGRLYLAQSLPYLKSSTVEERAQMVSLWLDFYKSEGFKHIRFLTTDSKWTTMDNAKHILWIPAVPIEKMPPESIKSVISEQMKQLAGMLTNSWISA